MRFALLLFLLSAEVVAQGNGRIYDRTCDVVSRRSSRGGVWCSPVAAVVPPSPAEFQFGPASGDGMPAPCAATSPTTSDGGALTFARSGVAECFSQDMQTMTQLATNQVRVMTCAVDRSVKGIYVENTARTNLVDDAQDMSVASWVKSNMTCAKTAVGLRGTANSASTCTATSANATVKHTLGEALGAYGCFSIAIKGRTVTGTVKLTIDGSVWLADIASQVSTSFWKRAVPGETVGCTAVAGGSSRCIVQAGLMDAPLAPIVGVQLANSGDSVDLDIAQYERCPDFRASSPIVTSGGNATRSAELADVAYNLGLEAQYCMAATLIQTAYSNTGAVGWAPTDAMRFAGVPGDRNPGVSTGSVNYLDSYYTRGTPSLDHSTTTLTTPALNESGMIWDGGTILRATSFWNMTNINSCLDGPCGFSTPNLPEGAFDDGGIVYTAPTLTRYRLGGYDSSAGGGAVNGCFSEVESSSFAVRCKRWLSIAAPSAYGAAIGDSTTWGTGPTIQGWPNAANVAWAAASRLQIVSLAKGSAFTGSSVATSGTGNNILRQWTDFVRGRGYTRLFVLGGINDVLTGISPVTSIANLTQIWDEARSDGIRLTVITLMPAGGAVGWNGTKQTSLETINTAVRSYAAAHANNTTLVDLYNSDLRVSDGGTAMNPLLTTDEVHPNALGANYAGQFIAAGSP